MDVRATDVDDKERFWTYRQRHRKDPGCRMVTFLPLRSPDIN